MVVLAPLVNPVNTFGDFKWGCCICTCADVVNHLAQHSLLLLSLCKP